MELSFAEKLWLTYVAEIGLGRCIQFFLILSRPEIKKFAQTFISIMKDLVRHLLETAEVQTTSTAVIGLAFCDEPIKLSVTNQF